MIVVCDIDGTVADHRHRLTHLFRQPKDWRRFHEEAWKDTPREDVREKVAALVRAGRELVYITARPEPLRLVTEAWLDRHMALPYDRLLMRAADDYRPDDVMKWDLFASHIGDVRLVDVVFEDRPRVVRMWRSRGLRVEDVGDGIEF